MGLSRVSRHHNTWSSILEIWLKLGLSAEAHSHNSKYMLDQRRAQKDGYITLREAAALSNYTSDYIGQLIRNGKIRGEQVYSNVAWVTTEEEIRAYMNDKTRSVAQSEEEVRIKVLGERAFSYVLYLVIAMLVLALLAMQYIFYVTIDDRVATRLQSTDIENLTETIPILSPSASLVSGI